MRITLNRTLLGTLFVLVLSACAVVFGQDTNFANGPQYMLQGSPIFARSLSTPTLSLNGPPLGVGASSATDGLTAGAGNQIVLPPNPGALPQVDLFPIYYGTPQPSVIEIPFPYEVSSQASVADFGVWQFTRPSALRESGYELTAAEAASQGKARSHPATRVYTNADIDRLQGRN